MLPNLGATVLSLSVTAFWSPSPHSSPWVLVIPLFSEAAAGQARTDFLLLPDVWPAGCTAQGVSTWEGLRGEDVVMGQGPGLWLRAASVFTCVCCCLGP